MMNIKVDGWVLKDGAPFKIKLNENLSYPEAKMRIAEISFFRQALMNQSTGHLMRPDKYLWDLLDTPQSREYTKADKVRSEIYQKEVREIMQKYPFKIEFRDLENLCKDML